MRSDGFSSVDILWPLPVWIVYKLIATPGRFYCWSDLDLPRSPSLNHFRPLHISIFYCAIDRVVTSTSWTCLRIKDDELRRNSRHLSRLESRKPGVDKELDEKCSKRVIVVEKSIWIGKERYGIYNCGRSLLDLPSALAHQICHPIGQQSAIYLLVDLSECGRILKNQLPF